MAFCRVFDVELLHLKFYHSLYDLDHEEDLGHEDDLDHADDLDHELDLEHEVDLDHLKGDVLRGDMNLFIAMYLEERRSIRLTNRMVPPTGHPQVYIHL